MQPVLYALSAFVVVGVVIASLVAIRRSQQGCALDLELTAAGWLDERLAHELPASHLSVGSLAA